MVREFQKGMEKKRKIKTGGFAFCFVFLDREYILENDTSETYIYIYIYMIHRQQHIFFFKMFSAIYYNIKIFTRETIRG